MLIIKINSNENTEFKGRFFKRQIRPDAFKRSSINIQGKTCTLIEINENNINTLNLERLFNTFKGQILGSEDVLRNLVSVEYRFNYKPYFKRALLSSLVNILGVAANKSSVCAIDNDFICTKEYVCLANSVKSFSLVSDESEETKRFSDICFVENGNYIKIASKFDCDFDIVVDFNKLDEDCKIIILKDSREQVLYPDPRYFTVSDDMLPVISFGIDTKLLCAAVEVVS